MMQAHVVTSVRQQSDQVSQHTRKSFETFCVDRKDLNCLASSFPLFVEAYQTTYAWSTQGHRRCSPLGCVTAPVYSAANQFPLSSSTNTLHHSRTNDPVKHHGGNH